MEEEKLESPKSKKNKRKTISNLIFLTLLTILVVVLILSLGEIKDIAHSFNEIGQNNNYVWLIAALALAIIYFLLWPFSQCIYGKALNVEATFGESYLIACSEHFYNGITPFAAGGQPFQIYSYTKRNVSTAKATGVILASFVTFMVVTNAFAVVSLFFWGDIWNGLVVLDKQSLIWVALVGFIINFLVLLFMFALGTSKKLRNFLVKLMNKFANWKIFHNEKHKLLFKFGGFLVKQVPGFEKYCDNAQIAFKEVWGHKGATALAIIIKVVDMACYYAIPFFLLKAVGIDVDWSKIPLILFATSFAITAVVWMPTPGGTGGIEVAFMLVIAAALAQNIEAGSIVLLWRMITFYFIILLSFACNALFEIIASHKMRKEGKSNV